MDRAFSIPKAVNLGHDKQAQAPGGSTFLGPLGMPRTHLVAACISRGDEGGEQTGRWQKT